MSGGALLLLVGIKVCKCNHVQPLGHLLMPHAKIICFHSLTSDYSDYK